MGMMAQPASIIVGESGQLARIDEFDRQYVTTPFTLLDYFSKYGLDDREIDTDTATGGTVTDNLDNSAIDLDVTASSGSRATACSKTFLRYQAGRGQDVLLTCYHSSTGETNQLRRWGYYDREEGDGLGFQVDGTTVGIFRLTSVSGESDETVTEADWNVRPNYVADNVDLTKGNIYEISFQWLGVGIVQFRINGILVHRMVNPNLYDAPYMRTGTLPVMASIENTGASSAATMTVICFSCTSEGGENPPEFPGAAQNSSDVSVAGTETAIIAIRPTATFNSVNNRMVVLPESVFIETDGDIRWRLLTNPTSLTGSWVSAGTNSGVEFMLPSAFTGGDFIKGGYSDSPGELFDLRTIFTRLGAKLRNPLYAAQEVLLLTAIRDGGGSRAVRGTFNWNEIL